MTTTFRSYAVTDLPQSQANTHMVVQIPYGVQAGDLLIMAISNTTDYLRNPDRGGQFYSVPAGWVCICDAQEAAEDNRLTVHVKIAAANEPNPDVGFRYYLGPEVVSQAIAYVYAFSGGFDPNLSNIIHASYNMAPWYNSLHTHTVNAVDDVNHPAGQIQNYTANVPETTPPITTTVPCTIIHFWEENVYPANLVPSAYSSDGRPIHDWAQLCQNPGEGDLNQLGVALYDQVVAGTTTMQWTKDLATGDAILWGFAITPSDTPPPPPPPPTTSAFWATEYIGIYRSAPQTGIYRRRKAPLWRSSGFIGSRAIIFNAVVTATATIVKRPGIKLTLIGTAHYGLAPSMNLAPSTSRAPSDNAPGFALNPNVSSSRFGNAQTLAASLALGPALKRLYSRLLQPPLIFTVAASRFNKRVFAVTASLTTAVTRKVSFTFARTIGLTQNMRLGNLNFISFPATLVTTLTVNTRKRAFRFLDGNVILAPAIRRFIGQRIIASVTMTPTQGVNRGQLYASSLVLSPALLRRKMMYYNLSAPFTLLPATSRRIFASYIFARTLNMTVGQEIRGAKETSQELSGSISFTPAMRRSVSKQIQAATVLLALASNLPEHHFDTVIHLAAQLSRKQARREQMALLIYMAAHLGVNPTLLYKPFGDTKIVSAILVSRRHG